MPKISQLINFQRIREVIDIDSDFDKDALVKNFVISPALQDHLVTLLKNINDSSHKAAQIIGGYGSGKSHLLAVLISLLTDRAVRNTVSNADVKAAANAMERDFVVVHWELQPNDVSLSEYFYDRVETQLAEKYGIEMDLVSHRSLDHKETVQRIIDRVKEGHPTRGFVVIVDEISDFLKQKTKEKIAQDVQFLRVLGQKAQASDFMFIGAMQEHIFSNPRYVDEAESFGRVSERFQIITITREDIKRVVAQRVLNKTPEQKIQLQELFNDYLKYFPALRAKLDEYVDLFPLHPYVIEVFSELPYFEKRGVIQFTMQEVEKILDCEFPSLVTYDRIYDEMSSKHTVKHLETVAPVVQAIATLDSKVDLMDSRRQELARKIIKALAVLKLLGKSNANGATVAELANTLLQLPGNKLLEAKDEIELTLKEFRKVTDGQFINVTTDGFYYLDLALSVDYDQVISRRAENLPENALDEELLRVLTEQLSLTPQALPYSFRDACRWSHHHSFREGLFIYETGKGDRVEAEGDYRVIFLSPFCKAGRYKASENCIVIKASLPMETTDALKKLTAARLLLEENYQRSIMEKRYQTMKKPVIEKLVAAWLASGSVDVGKGPKTIKSIISREFQNFAELLSEIKPLLLEDFFDGRFPKHPKFAQFISRDNIAGEFSAAVKELIVRGGAQTLFAGSKTILKAMDLLDDDGGLTTTRSETALEIVALAKEQAGNMVEVSTVVNRFSLPPYGYDRWMTALLLIVLTYNGEITLRAAGGKQITSSEVPDVFSSGLSAFENIKYFALESDFNPQPIIDLMQALGIDAGTAAKMRVTNRRCEALQALRTRYLELAEQKLQVEKQAEKLAMQRVGVLDLDGLRQRQDELKVLPFAELEKVKTPNDLKKIVYSESVIKEIRQAHQTLLAMQAFYAQYQEQLDAALDYALEVQTVLEKHPYLFPAEVVETIRAFWLEAQAVLASADRLLVTAERQPLLGKMQHIKQKYVAAYYGAHEKFVGGKVDWAQLSDCVQSLRYQNLQMLKNLSILAKHSFYKLELEASAIANLHCADFRVERIEKKAYCPQCGFPQDFSGTSPAKRIEAFADGVEQLYHEWERTILSELSHYKDNLDLLTDEDKKLVCLVLKAGKLPEAVDENLIVALNNLFKELVPVDINPQDILQTLFAEASVLDYYTFEKRLNEWKHNLTKGQDLDKIRFKSADRK